MAVKIKPFTKKKKIKRVCNICKKTKDMEPNQRFCSHVCRQTANELGKYGNEHNVHIGKK